MSTITFTSRTPLSASTSSDLRRQSLDKVTAPRGLNVFTKRVLVTAPYFQPVVERYRGTFEAHGVELIIPPVRERLEEAELIPLIGDIDGMLCGDDRVTARVLDHAPRLRAIAKWGTGTDSIDRTACTVRGVQVLNTPGAFTEPVADSVLSYILSFARRTPWMDRAMKAGEWEKIPGRALFECTLGIIGVGAIGRGVARRATAFGMRVLGHDLLPLSEDFRRECPIETADFSTVLAESDFLSVNCDLNPTSHHLLNSEAFCRMKPSAVVINCARGPVIEETALVQALLSGQIAGAGLDVFEHEPLPNESPLRWMDNVLLAPHNSNSSPTCWERVHESTMRQLLEALG